MLKICLIIIIIINNELKLIRIFSKGQLEKDNNNNKVTLLTDNIISSLIN